MIEFITSAAILVSSMYGSATTTASTTAAITASSSQPVAIVVALSTTTAFTDNTGVMAYVKQQYAGDPILVNIAACESTFRQYDAKTGDVLHGKVDSQDIGVMQINQKYQGDKAASMGFNIDTVEGNVAYAKYLYETQGAAPWSASSQCWSKSYAANISASNANVVAVK
jgi:hypothetical protein